MCCRNCLFTLAVVVFFATRNFTRCAIKTNALVTGLKKALFHNFKPVEPREWNTRIFSWQGPVTFVLNLLKNVRDFVRFHNLGCTIILCTSRLFLCHFCSSNLENVGYRRRVLWICIRCRASNVHVWCVINLYNMWTLWKITHQNSQQLVNEAIQRWKNCIHPWRQGRGTQNQRRAEVQHHKGYLF